MGSFVSATDALILRMVLMVDTGSSQVFFLLSTNWAHIYTEACPSKMRTSCSKNVFLNNLNMPFSMSTEEPKELSYLDLLAKYEIWN